MPSEERLRKVIELLIRDTTEGRVKWKAAFPPNSRTQGTDDIIQDYFEAEYKGQTVAVFERRYRAYNDETDSTYWASDYSFAFVAYGNVTWETEDSPLLASLFKAAKESAADVDGILDALLR